LKSQSSKNVNCFIYRDAKVIQACWEIWDPWGLWGTQDGGEERGIQEVLEKRGIWEYVVAMVKEV
jgi:hypothetical protein